MLRLSKAMDYQDTIIVNANKLVYGDKIYPGNSTVIGFFRYWDTEEGGEYGTKGLLYYKNWLGFTYKMTTYEDFPFCIKMGH